MSEEYSQGGGQGVVHGVTLRADTDDFRRAMHMQDLEVRRLRHKGGQVWDWTFEGDAAWHPSRVKPGSSCTGPVDVQVVDVGTKYMATAVCRDCGASSEETSTLTVPAMRALVLRKLLMDV